MRKQFRLLGTLFLLLALGAAMAGCSGNGTPPDADEPTDDQPQPVAITLPSNPTTGYDWQCELADDSSGEVNVEFEFSPADSELVGAPGVDNIYLTGVSAGTVNLTFWYTRAWLDDPVAAAEGRADYIIVVGDDLSVSIVSAELSLPEVFADWQL